MILNIGNKKILIVSLKVIILLTLFLPTLGVVGAQTQPYQPQPYTVLSPLPGTTDPGSNNKTTDLTRYLPGIFNLAMGVAAFMAFVMITYGGIMYMTTDALSGKTDGRKKVTDAVIGLLLVIGAWVILNTINPKILTFSLDPAVTVVTQTPVTPVVPPPSGSPYTSSTVMAARVPGQPLPGYTLTTQEIIENTRMISDLLNNNPSITVTSTSRTNNPCSEGQTTGCTNIVGLPPNAISGVKQIATDCGCELTITGGTEGGHKTHGPGMAAMDLHPTSGLTSLLGVNGADPGLPNLTELPQITLSTGQKATFMWETDPPHWHVKYP